MALPLSSAPRSALGGGGGGGGGAGFELGLRGLARGWASDILSL